MPHVSDRELWERASSGDVAAFGDLFERHARAVYNFCFRRTADWSLAEDITSAVFLEAWRRRSEVRMAGDSTLPFLFGVAVNLVRNARRSLRRHRAALARLPEPLPTPDIADDVAGRLDDRQRMRAILRLIARLPRRDRDVLSLCVWTGLSYEEAATALEVPVGTVRSRLARARGRLRELSAESGHHSDEDRALARAALAGWKEEQ